MSGSAERDLGPTAPLLHLRLLGGFAATREAGAPTVERWSRPSSRTLVKLLAVAPEHQLHREQVIDACWPETDLASGLGSLRVALHAARRALEPDLAPRASSSYLIADGAMLRLDRRTVRVDLDEAEALATAALDGRDPDRLAAALRALSGELLPEDRYAPWVQPRSERLLELRGRVRVVLAESLLATGALEETIGTARDLLAETPGEERGHRVLIEALLASGLRREAVRQFHRCRDALDIELGIRPSAETERLYREALAAGERGVMADGGPVAPPAALAAATGPLRGREHDLADLEDRTGPPVQLVRAEAGVGKTRLVTEVARRAAQDGAVVLWGAGHESEGRAPYGAFVEALDGWLAGRTAEERARVGIEYPELAALLPALGLAGADPERSPERERERLFGATVSILRELGELAPVLLVLDDLQAADVGSWQLLSHLARRIDVEGLPVRVLATFRADGLPDGSSAVLDAVRPTGLVRELALGRVERAACLAIAADVLGVPTEQVPPRVWELSLGNPLFAVEVAREGGAGDGSPRAVRELVGARLTRLPPAARAVVEVVAVAGGQASLSEVFDVAAAAVHPPLSAAEAATGVDVAIAASLLAEHELVVDGRSVPALAFRHPMLGLTCYEGLTGPRRRLLHTAYADAVLRTRPDALDTLANHLSQADDPRAVIYLRAAAERAAAVFANDAADQYYAELTQRLDDYAAEAATARVQRGAVLRRMGRFEEASRVLREGVAGLRARGDRDGVVLATARLAEVLAKTDPPDVALALLDADPPDEGTAAGVAAAHYVSRSLIHGVAGSYAEAVDEARLATTYAEEMAGLEQRGLLARALSLMATSLALDGRFAEAGPIADQALPHAEAFGDPQMLGSVLSVLREQARRSGRLADAVAIGRRALALNERSGNATSASFERANLAELLLLRGEQDEARELARSAIDEASSHRTWVEPYARITCARLAMETGTPGAGEHVEQAARLALEQGDQQAQHEAGAARVELELRRARPADAAAALDLLAGGAGTMVLRAWVELALGRPERALEVAERERRRARIAGERIVEVDAGLAAAAAGGAAGRFEERDRALAEAESLADRLGYVASFGRAELAVRR